MQNQNLPTGYYEPGSGLVQALSSQYPGLNDEQIVLVASELQTKFETGIKEGKHLGLAEGPYDDGSFDVTVYALNDTVNDVLKRPRGRR